VFGCSANFSRASATSAVAAAASSGDRTLERTARVLSGEPVRRTHRRDERRRKRDTPAAPQPKATATPAPKATPTPAPDASKTDTLLDYLFGGEK
jgi:hypothetical protein